MELTQSIIDQAKEGTDTAIYVIGRNAGEGADRSSTTKKTRATINGEEVEFEVGDYELTETEKASRSCTTTDSTNSTITKKCYIFSFDW